MTILTLVPWAPVNHIESEQPMTTPAYEALNERIGPRPNRRLKATARHTAEAIMYDGVCQWIFWRTID